ncbi:MAG: hypothetical protein HZC37_04250 [Burkholderiales bacterium]|nr:hypothetical protein [Burkholderiales bacterium]
MPRPQALLEAVLHELRVLEPQEATAMHRFGGTVALTVLRAATVLLALMALASLSAPAAFGAAPKASEQAQVDQAAAQVAGELARICPVADAGDEPALNDCRAGLYGDSQLRRHLQKIVLWGRQADPGRTLKETGLTQFAPDVLTGMYLPLFMFNGDYVVQWHEGEGLHQIRLRTAFRNGLAPGHFPYPFWHEAEKWSMYENANELILWWDARAASIKAAQFTMHGANPPVRAVARVKPPAFDGQWRWTDDGGRTQPAVSAFVGLLRRDNPHLPQVEAAYRNFALRLREGQCMDCHVPNNPDKMTKLVLLQTPVHAAAEIKRVLKSVLEDRMPRDDAGIEQPLDARAKATLLAEGAAFDRVLDQARQWEAGQVALASVRTKAGPIAASVFRNGLAPR